MYFDNMTKKKFTSVLNVFVPSGISDKIPQNQQELSK